MSETEVSPSAVLSPEILAECRDRAPGYDREDCFFSEDFERLRAAGYLDLAIPRELGGPGHTLAEVVREHDETPRWG